MADAFGLRLLGLQTSWQGSMGVETSAVAGAELSVTGYYQHYQLTDLRDPSLFQLDTLASDLLMALTALAFLAILQNFDVVLLGSQAPGNSGSYAAISVACKPIDWP